MTRPDEHGREPTSPPGDEAPPSAEEPEDALNLQSAEDLDEDRLGMDPLEEGRDPAEGWSGATKPGLTPFEETRGETLDQRLAEEEPDFGERRPSDRREEPEEDRQGGAYRYASPGGSPEGLTVRDEPNLDLAEEGLEEDAEGAPGAGDTGGVVAEEGFDPELAGSDEEGFDPELAGSDEEEHRAPPGTTPSEQSEDM
ncbi:hypothetical protein LX15_001395 [Streptoalloteichus tenebrarius]|uniref:DUF5709 domain-containing protein n=1 Tax=Streptoalloteichus tenebrarius (strain ATCC 17920 / DSM 40477 / JCM 4838 / CBS 697.72 / NBRC 16177 / NCIMB 11028 / NRRL B-12390 / A12253. 1 / ISP 5477) TaxID=1933 RepID=A0ABT1HQA3_STRSD|nr:hypothetical protein [Streptoalloteichus tenebrarius]MCP2257709.1 hypothetical protein [Streptoalloteichus tenebrarius]BFE99937.1 hypothetical protein GCM10020241_16130 [Streptoalloteichus tenebrarius]